MEKKCLIDRYFDIATRRGGSSISKKSLEYYVEYLFQNVSFFEKSMLDIGGGSGLFSFYGAIMGAKKVLCLEPEARGSTKGILHKFKQLSASLLLNNIDLQPLRFQDFDAGTENFEIVLLHNSINHLEEEACKNLQYADDARNKYDFIFQKLSEISAAGAKLIIADCSRQNFFALCGIKNPFAPTIEWNKHQSPEFWVGMLSKYGFVNPKIRWSSFSFLRKIGRVFLGNRIASYFLTSHFCLTMEKK
jgi:hypothetical protein